MRMDHPRETHMTDSQAALKLQSWFSPAFPIGAFSYSHGLEPAIEAQAVTDRPSLVRWIEVLLERGSARVDAMFFADAWRVAPDGPAAAKLAEEAHAWIATAELQLEAEQQGDSFLKTIAAAWPLPAVNAFREALTIRPPLSVVAGFVSGAHKAPLDYALPLFLQAFAVNIVSAGVRLIPLGQTDGQQATAALEPVVTRAAAAAIAAGPGEAATATPAHDIASMRHETQYARIFRS